MVGKLNIKESDFSEKKDVDEKPVVNIGKLDASGLFNPASDEKDVKFYKPIVQPKKIKIQNVFPESSESTNTQALLKDLCNILRNRKYPNGDLMITNYSSNLLT